MARTVPSREKTTQANTSFSYFAVIQNQVLANIGLALTMIIVVAVLYFKKELDVFPKYFQDNNAG